MRRALHGDRGHCRCVPCAGLRLRPPAHFFYPYFPCQCSHFWVVPGHAPHLQWLAVRALRDGGCSWLEMLSPPHPLSPSGARPCHSEGCMCCRWPHAVPKPPREELIASRGDLGEGCSPSLLPTAFSSCCLGLAAVLHRCPALAVASLGAVVRRLPRVGGSVPYHGGLWPLSYSEMHSLCSTEH